MSHVGMFTIASASVLLVATACKKDPPPLAPPPAVKAEEKPESAKVPEKMADDKKIAVVAPEAASPTAAAPVAGDAVAVWKAAMETTPKCPLDADNVSAKDYSLCLKPVWDALKSIDDPDGANYDEKQAKAKPLKAKLAKELELMLGHPNKTVVFYAVFQNQTRFEPSPRLFAKLEQLMNDDHPGTAEWAAVARFWKRDKADAATLEKAKAVLAAHKHERVRQAGCQYVGDGAFKGERGHVDLLLGYAKNKEENKLVRSCSVTQLGTIGEDKDVKVLAEFLNDLDTQYAAVYALKLGIRSKAAMDSYVDFFAAHAKKPGTIDFGALIIVVPYDNEMDKFNKPKMVKALVDLVVNKEQARFVRTQAADTLGKLKGKEDLQKALGLIKDSGPDADSVKKAIEDALAKAG